MRTIPANIRSRDGSVTARQEALAERTRDGFTRRDSTRRVLPGNYRALSGFSCGRIPSNYIHAYGQTSFFSRMTCLCRRIQNNPSSNYTIHNIRTPEQRSSTLNNPRDPETPHLLPRGPLVIVQTTVKGIASVDQTFLPLAAIP